jgi:hypothetical protein
MENLLTESQASIVLNCSKAALRRWRRERRGPKYLKMGRLVRYRQSDLIAFIEHNSRGGSTGSSAGSIEP